MEQVVADLTQRSNGLEAEVRELREKLAGQEQRNLTKAEAPSAAAESDTVTTNTAPAGPVQPQPFQARAYVGNDYLGIAWVIPSNVKEHAESGEYRFEPVIWIDAKARQAFTQTNVVEREVVRHNTYNHTYAYQQPYWYGYPLWVKPQDDQPIAPPQRPQSPVPSPGQGGVWSSSGGGERTTHSNNKPRVTDSLGGTRY
jgi:hypothetical protein